ncbi:MAG TPA: cytidine deaminase, partial [Thermoanaerobaculia bacterium]|nr:cytidine deaminase [Thermoanaerobaculia bacterium]
SGRGEERRTAAGGAGSTPGPGWDELVAAAHRARAAAHAPWSGYRVGAALRADDGTVWAAGNVELTIPATGLCAERNAVHAALGAGRRRVVALAVVTASSPPACPCGVCRQVLLEVVPEGEELPILCVNDDGERLETTLGELLPHAFRLPGPG